MYVCTYISLFPDFSYSAFYVFLCHSSSLLPFPLPLFLLSPSSSLLPFPPFSLPSMSLLPSPFRSSSLPSLSLQFPPPFPHFLSSFLSRSPTSVSSHLPLLIHYIYGLSCVRSIHFCHVLFLLILISTAFPLSTLFVILFIFLLFLYPPFPPYFLLLRFFLLFCLFFLSLPFSPRHFTSPFPLGFFSFLPPLLPLPTFPFSLLFLPLTLVSYFSYI